MVRGLSWQRSHRTGGSVDLRLDGRTRIRLSPRGKLVSIARFARFMKDRSLVPIIVTWRSTPDTSGGLVREPLAAVTVSPR